MGFKKVDTNKTPIFLASYALIVASILNVSSSGLPQSCMTNSQTMCINGTNSGSTAHPNSFWNTANKKKNFKKSVGLGLLFKLNTYFKR